jgi:hypothetical protein
LATVAAIDYGAIRALTEPFRGSCPACGVEVVVVDLAGEDVVLEVLEVLATMRCSRCASNMAQGKTGSDPRAKPCERCGGTGLVGQELPSVGVAVAEDGRARPFVGGPLARGECVQQLHSCPLDT